MNSEAPAAPAISRSCTENASQHRWGSSATSTRRSRRLSGDRAANSLTSQEVRRLYRALVETVHNGIKYRGTSVDGFLDVFGEPGGYDEYLEVYGRAGERSRNGRGEVMKQKISGMTHYYSDYQV